jgi:Spy/CpxP family protein refolding chaperone
MMGGASAALVALAVAITPAPVVAGVFGRHGGGHGFFARHHRFDPDRLAHGVEWALRDVDASEEQVAQVTAILEQAFADLRGVHEGAHERMGALSLALTGESVDRAALEQLRDEHVGMADVASTRLVAALADAADVLSPDQRRALVEHHQRHHEDP